MENTVINSYLTFSLGKEIFAAHVKIVLNILELVPITHVPKSPDYMTGVINLRGSVLPVIDGNLKLGMPKTEATGNTCILVTEVLINDENVKMGILVDSVFEVLEVDYENILPAPSFGSKYKSEFILGIFKVNEQFAMILDLEKIFATDELILISDIISEEESELNSSNSSQE